MSTYNSFSGLVAKITNTDIMLKANVYAVINRSVTARAWLTGMYIVEYEQRGSDRAKYGEKLLKNLSKRLGENSYSISTLKDYRQFYLYYPQLLAPLKEYLIREFPVLSPEHPLLSKSQPPAGELEKGVAEEISHPLAGFFLQEDQQPIVGVSRDGFVQQYSDGSVELQLPAKEKIQQFLMRENTIKR